MTADGWIPTGGRRPEGLADGTPLNVTDFADRVRTDYGIFRPERMRWDLWKFYRLAQPAAQEWHSCDLHKPRKDGDVVEIRDLVTGFDAVGVWTRGHWHVSHDRDSLPGRVYRHEYFDHLLHNAEWRYPAAGLSDADQRESEHSIRPQSIRGNSVQVQVVEPADSHPYRSRNGYGLRIREADEREREPLLISYDVFRRMK